MAGFDEALQESVVFLDHFADLPDPRQLIKVIYPLDEILLLSLLAVMAGAETFTAIAQFGKRKNLLRRLRPFANGTPDHDRLGAVFAALIPIGLDESRSSISQTECDKIHGLIRIGEVRWTKLPGLG